MDQIFPNEIREAGTSQLRKSKSA